MCTKLLKVMKAITMVRLDGRLVWFESSLCAHIYCWFCHNQAQNSDARVVLINPLYSDGFYHTDKSNMDVIMGSSRISEKGVHIIYKGVGVHFAHFIPFFS